MTMIFDLSEERLCDALDEAGAVLALVEAALAPDRPGPVELTDEAASGAYYLLHAVRALLDAAAREAAA
jgi:hypothetical protein